MVIDQSFKMTLFWCTNNSQRLFYPFIERSEDLKKKKRLNNNYKRSRMSDYKGSRKEDQKGCFNCKKPGHFIADCPDRQKEKSKDKSKKSTFKSNKIKKQIKQSLTATWEDLDSESESDKCNALFNYLIYLLSLEYNYMIYVIWRIMWCVVDLFRDLFYYLIEQDLKIK